MVRTVLVAAALSLLASAAPAHARASCEITFRLGTSTALNTLNVFANYENAVGEFSGTSTNVECEALNSTIISVGDVDAARTLSMAAVGLPMAIQGPKDILRCTWLPLDGAPEVSHFDMSEQEATNTNGQPVDPDVTVSDIECEGFATTTTLQESVCGDFNANDSLEITDALGILRASVGVAECNLCVCDVNGNGDVTVTDALVTLRISVGQNVATNCSAC